MPRYPWVWLVCVSACAHVGSGDGLLVAALPAGDVAPPAPIGKVAFGWHSRGDASKGELQAVLPNGTRYAGSYLQLRADVETSTLGPSLVVPKLPEWAQDPWFGAAPDYQVDGSSNRLVALLTDAAGEQMRCKFLLFDAESGIQGGGGGACVLSDDEQVLEVRLK